MCELRAIKKLTRDFVLLFLVVLTEICNLTHVSDAIFGYIEDVPDISWHNPPCRQYIILLKGAMEIEVGNGASQVFNEGDILLAEDTVGQGHITRAASEGSRHYLALPLKDQ